MLSGIPASRLWRSRRPSQSKSGVQHSGSFAAEKPKFNQSPGTEDSDEQTELASLNAALGCLTAIFQDVQVEVLREMLSTFSEESRLQLVTECLLKHKDKWVKGRWKVPDPYRSMAESRGNVQPQDRSILPRKEQFRSSQYKIVVKEALYREFKTLSHSSIKAILAEHNYSYLDSRVALIELMSKSWRVSVTNLIFRRKIPLPEQCPLIYWLDSTSESKEPDLIPTDSYELNEELEHSVIAELKAKVRDEQVRKDVDYALQVNEEEAELAGAMYECQCCFTPSVFERVISCDSYGHFVCFRCISSSMNEALYGQGWSSNIDRAKASLRCIALQESSTARCQGCFSRHATRQALLTESSGREQWNRFETQMAEQVITQIQEPVSRCPYCHYAEIHATQPTSLNLIALAYSRRIGPVIFFILLALFISPIQAVLAAILANYICNRSWQELTRLYIPSSENGTNMDPTFGTKFVCRNISCLRSSCLRCRAPWADIHICHQSSRQALRTFVESAVTDAIKRTCPKCNLSFIKSSGCNKLVCVCGYSMCYVCRQDVGKSGYTHFCPHFRPNPGQPCEECDRCDLYRTEDEDKVIAEARQKAIAAWKEQRGENEDGDVVANEIMSETETKNDRKGKKWTIKLL